MAYTTHFPWAILQIPPGLAHPYHSFTTNTTHSPKVILHIAIHFQIYIILSQSFPIQLNPLGRFPLPQTLLPIPPWLSSYTNQYPRNIISQLNPYDALPASIVLAITRDFSLVKCLLVAYNSTMYSEYGIKLVNL